MNGGLEEEGGGDVRRCLIWTLYPFALFFDFVYIFLKFFFTLMLKLKGFMTMHGYVGLCMAT